MGFGDGSTVEFIGGSEHDEEQDDDGTSKTKDC